jgi:succinate-semialdehyde dehydrogenase/glutarate-semialdehyde dehydrogenase
MLQSFHDRLFDRRREVADVIMRETDKPVAEALAAEVAVALDETRFIAAAVPRMFRTRWTASGSLAFARKRLRVTREPHGVVGVITPWNYPLMLSCARLLPALVTGNAVVYKPSELAPSTGELVRDLLLESGFPSAVVHLVQGDGRAGAALASGDVDKVFFTGSVGAGRSVAHACAERLAPCALELGGSDAAIVLADADVGTAASGLAWGRFGNAGQTCVAPKRVFVEEGAYDAFLAAICRVVSQLRVGPGGDPATDVGAMIRPELRAVIEAQRDDAVARGARVAAVAPPGGQGQFPPTVLVDVPDGARALTEETFGPLMVVIRVRDADTAVARANASDFGLSASVWSRDGARAVRIAERLACGTVAVNDVVLTAGVAELPHGGVRRSGYGRTHGEEGLAECVRTRGIVADRFPRWRQGWWFGYSATHAQNVDAFIRVAHDSSLLGRLRALPGFLRVVFRPDRPV